MKRVLAQAVKELSQFWRDRLTVALAIVLPLLTLFIFGFAIRLESQNLPLVIQDLDNSPRSRAYIEQLFATNQFKPVPWPQGLTPEAALDQGQARAVVVIPPDFQRQMMRGETATVQVLIDGTDANNARFLQNALRATTHAFNQAMTSPQRPPPVAAETRLWFNPGRQETLFIVPGVMGVVLWVYPSLLAAIAMVREKDRGTIIQVYASDLRAEELLLGKGLAYLAIGGVEALVVIGLGMGIFGLRWAGDPLPFLLGTLVFLAAAVMFGLFIGVRANSQNVAVQGVALIGFLTALLLSGFIYPLANIPFPLSLISHIVPARYYIELSRNTFVRGSGWSGVWWQVAMIVLLGWLLFSIARRLLRRMQLPD
ncbi:MAG TPA: ABC transporter permease [Leptolyngbyaceae cyanobacterium M65_K2018_010]|nr:ABC transporter permease [Leptolyngbyaceae cyanobacterium M65_K2018_010]